MGCYVRHIEEKKGRKVAKSLINADRDLWTSPTEQQKRTTGVSRWRNNPRKRKKVQDDAVYEAKESWVTMDVNDDKTRGDYFALYRNRQNLSQTVSSNEEFKGISLDM